MHVSDKSSSSGSRRIRDYDYKLMAKYFEMQQALRPSLTKAVFHGIISFYPVEKIEDKMMVDIAKNICGK